MKTWISRVTVGVDGMRITGDEGRRPRSTPRPRLPARLRRIGGHRTQQAPAETPRRQHRRGAYRAARRAPRPRTRSVTDARSSERSSRHCSPWSESRGWTEPRAAPPSRSGRVQHVRPRQLGHRSLRATERAAAPPDGSFGARLQRGGLTRWTLAAVHLGTSRQSGSVRARARARRRAAIVDR